MIIARSPLRITLGGGGTDLPSYYRQREGFLIAAAIDRYVYITIHDTFVDDLIVKYSEMERVGHAKELKHPIIREALALMDMDGRSMEITSMADIPAGTGLGSSGSFTTALLKALHAHRRHAVLPEDIARQACEIELDRLMEPIGKQDQYIAAYGGVTCFTFGKDDSVRSSPLTLGVEDRNCLEENLLLFFTGFSRKASTILKEQDTKSRSLDPEMMDNLDYVKDLGQRSQRALQCGNFPTFARLMDEHWQHKKRRSNSMSNGMINEWYDLAMRNGAMGGKLIGAGGGGFLMFYTEDRTRLRRAMAAAGLPEVRFRFDYDGTKVVSQ
jgi:D-glycero-alpha-D-manno-heptose-7-phosphate kinase